MPKYRHKSESDPSRLLDDDVEDREPESRPRRASSGPKNHRRHRDVSTGDRPQSRGQKNVRPEGVSERVWGLADQWLEMGEAHFGKRPPVNKQEFAKRLDAKINGDRSLRRWILIPAEKWQDAFGGTWEDGIDFVQDVLVKMLELFYRHLTEEQHNTAALQFAFLEDEWDEWVYQATTAVQAAWHKAHSEWARYPLPTAVFDRSLPPRPDDVHPDPFWEGKTFAEVEAINEADLQTLEPLSDEDYEQGQQQVREEIRATGERLATVKAAMLANREKRN